MELSSDLRDMYVQTAETLRGAERRRFMAQVTKMLGPGGQRQAEAVFGWNRGTIRKGLIEMEGGAPLTKAKASGRKAAEHHLPHLLDDICDLLKQRSSSAAVTRDRLISDKGYTHDALPSSETIRKKINRLRTDGLI